MPLRADVQDTIVALSSAAGPGGRAIVRLSGPGVQGVVRQLFRSRTPVSPGHRRRYVGELHLAGLSSPLPADLYFWPGPHSYTGQHLAEFHLLSCPPLVQQVVAACLAAGARAALPGEFTLRAFLAGKLDLTRAEAVRAVIEAGSPEELRQALGQLAGALTEPLCQLRQDLLDLLAEVEASLDFAEEDLTFLSPEELLRRLARGLAQVKLLRKQLARRALGERPFRVVLAGRPNAGKSSLFNALAGASALVSPLPGTTRDYLVCQLEWDGVLLELVDTAGWQEAHEELAAQAQSHSQAQLAAADLILLCLEAGRPPDLQERDLLDRWPERVLPIATKCDLSLGPEGLVATSVHTGAGLAELRQLLVERARSWRRPALAPSLGRCHRHLEACGAHLRRAHACVLHQEPPELLALELRGALEELGEIVGALYTDDLLDRIFSRFCIGK